MLTLADIADLLDVDPSPASANQVLATLRLERATAMTAATTLADGPQHDWAVEARQFCQFTQQVLGERIREIEHKLANPGKPDPILDG